MLRDLKSHLTNFKKYKFRDYKRYNMMVYEKEENMSKVCLHIKEANLNKGQCDLCCEKIRFESRKSNSDWSSERYDNQFLKDSRSKTHVHWNEKLDIIQINDNTTCDSDNDSDGDGESFKQLRPLMDIVPIPIRKLQPATGTVLVHTD